MTVSPERLSRLVSHALRHEPWIYELELDDEGWVPIDTRCLPQSTSRVRGGLEWIEMIW